jgi:ATP/maltotriose-dependent transcriptional regulator MalT
MAEGAMEASRAVEIAREEGDHEARVIVETMSAEVAWLAGRIDDALAHARSSIELSQRVGGVTHMISRAYVLIGAALIEGGEWAKAIRALEAVASLPESWAFAQLAKAKFGIGDAEGARALAAEGVAATVAGRYLVQSVEARCVFAQILLHTEGPIAREAVEAELARADAIIEQTGARAYAPFVLVERAALALTLGDKAGRERLLREAQQLWLEMGATGWAVRIAHELEQEATSVATSR